MVLSHLMLAERASDFDAAGMYTGVPSSRNQEA
jgi:hypothetical protein